ncbi:MAG: peptidoglycan editing factor PgeF [Xanthomonadales bacterium]|nr:peptidoglycan editing factor PgeF [Xanthomonadales bacterium]
MKDLCIEPDWPAPKGVRALQTTREGGVSQGPWRSLNLGEHSGDEVEHVRQNRQRLAALLPARPAWPRQVHGNRVLSHAQVSEGARDADAVYASGPGQVCGVLTADCLPVLFTDRDGGQVAVAHAGWRGLAAGVLEQTVASMRADPGALLAWLGPAIGPDHFQVGPEVREAFLAWGPDAGQAFEPDGDAWLADLYLLARQRLAGVGVTAVFGGGLCTVCDAGRFFSYRRDGQTGRMGTLVWKESG